MSDGSAPGRIDEAPKLATGRRAALTLPRGVEETVMFAAAIVSEEDRRLGRRTGAVGEEGLLRSFDRLVRTGGEVPPSDDTAGDSGEEKGEGASPDGALMTASARDKVGASSR